MTAALLLGTVLGPAVLLLACLWPGVRARSLSLLAWAPLPGLLCAVFAVQDAPLVLDPDRLRLTLMLDAPGAILLGVAALLWSAAGAYAACYLRDEPNQARFAVSWLLTLAGSLGVFIAGDLLGFYLLFAMVSLSAYGLVVQDGTARARSAGTVYLVLAVVGEICLLLAFALMQAATPGESLAIRDVVAALPASPWHGLTIALLILGFGLKAGLVPLHVWLPLAHPAAPMPASAVLSGAIIKAGVIGLIRFLPEGLVGWDQVLVALGFVTAFYGVAIGITQANPKTVLAYSSVSQMGVVVAVMGLAAGDGAAFYAAHHVLAKGALFLGVGVVAACGQRRLWLVLAPLVVLAFGFGGLPLTGGAMAKLAVKDAFGDGILGLLGNLSAAGTTMLMVHFLRRVATKSDDYPATVPPAGLVLPWLVMALAAVALPWLLFPGDPAEALAPKALWAGLWPVLLGLAGGAALIRWGARLPVPPEGDLLVFSRAIPPALNRLGAAMEAQEAVLRRWPVAGLCVLAVVLALTGAMLRALP